MTQAGLLSHKGLFAAWEPARNGSLLALPSSVAWSSNSSFPSAVKLSFEMHTTASARGNGLHSRLDMGNMVKQNWKKKKQLKKRKYHNGFSREAVFGAVTTEYEENQTWIRLLALSTTLGNFLNLLEPQIPQILNRHKDKVNVSCKKEVEESMRKAWQRVYYGVKGQC